MELLELAAARKGGKGATGRASGKSVLKELGEHPDGGAIQVLDGRYGPYVKYNKINATLPKELKPDAVTLELALGLIAEKASSKGGTATKSTARKSSPAKSAVKSTTKSAAKSPSKSTTKSAGSTAKGKAKPVTKRKAKA